MMKIPIIFQLQNVLRQSLQLIAQVPSIMTAAYQVKRRVFDGKSMYLHPVNKDRDNCRAYINADSVK